METAANRVRAFYEAHPYPPPETDLGAYAERWASDAVRRRATHHLFWPAVSAGSPRSILVAGCGTAQAARHALRDRSRRVVGIDVSRTAIDATLALKDRHALDNLEVRRLPVEEAAALEESFDLVVCTGVLHHLPDPGEGVAALRGVLAPGGAAYLMVYATYGRAGVYLMQRYARLLEVLRTEGEIADLRETLREIPKGHPLRALFAGSPDFTSPEGMADALLNPLDRAYSVPEFLALARDAGLRLGRWHRQAPYLPTCGSPRLTPHGDRLAELPTEDQWTAMELFRGTMLRHSGIFRRDDEPPAAPEVPDTWEGGEGWRSWVPVRRPDTIEVRERVPPPHAAVLINRTHTYPDLYLPVDRRELDWWRAIDGTREVGEIIGPGGEAAKARDLFRRLWEHDQVVFDTSAPEAGAHG